MTNEIIYIAKPTWYTEKLYPNHRRFFEKFYPQLAQYHEVRALELPDIWVRDFFPLQNKKTGELYQHFFDPRDSYYKAKFTAAIRSQVRGVFPHAKFCDVCIEGGNIVITPDKKYAFCLEKRSIFPKSNPTKKEYVEKELKQALGVEGVFWIPKQNLLSYSRMSEYVQFLGNFLMEGSLDYEGTTTGSFLEDRGMLYDYMKNLNYYDDYHDDIVHLLCFTTNREHTRFSGGCYVNFLETSRAVFVPQFNSPEDKRALTIIQEYTKKPIVPVDCSAFSHSGGAVYRLTREYSFFPEQV